MGKKKKAKDKKDNNYLRRQKVNEKSTFGPKESFFSH